jgi:hypothetical protein
MTPAVLNEPADPLPLYQAMANEMAVVKLTWLTSLHRPEQFFPQPKIYLLAPSASDTS